MKGVFETLGSLSLKKCQRERDVTALPQELTLAALLSLAWRRVGSRRDIGGDQLQGRGRRSQNWP